MDITLWACDGAAFPTGGCMRSIGQSDFEAVLDELVLLESDLAVGFDSDLVSDFDSFLSLLSEPPSVLSTFLPELFL